MVLDPPTFRDHPSMKSQLDLTLFGVGVPSDMMAIAIVLNICLNTCLSAHGSGLVCLREVRFACLVIASVTCVNGSFNVEGEGGTESQVVWEEAPTLLGGHNTTICAQLLELKSTRMW